MAQRQLRAGQVNSTIMASFAGSLGGGVPPRSEMLVHVCEIAHGQAARLIAVARGVWKGAAAPSLPD